MIWVQSCIRSVLTALQMALNVQHRFHHRSVAKGNQGSMGKALHTRAVAVVLALVTLLVCALGVANFLQENSYEAPTDGVWWVESTGTIPGLIAERVPQTSTAHRGGVRTGDLLLAANKRKTTTDADLEREMSHTGTWGHITYSLVRGRAPLEVPVILEPTDRARNQGLRLIALAYLAIGMYVLLRRWTAPKATHFYVFCLVSGVLYSFRYTGVFDALDWICYWGAIIAGALQPALFLHFAISFGEGISFLRRRVLAVALYVPGLVMLGLQIAAITQWAATERLKHRLDQFGVGYLALYYVIAAGVFWLRYQTADKPLERQQLKWLSRGALLSVVPFTALYAIPYLMDADIPVALTRAAGFTLIYQHGGMRECNAWRCAIGHCGQHARRNSVRVGDSMVLVVVVLLLLLLVVMGGSGHSQRVRMVGRIQWGGGGGGNTGHGEEWGCVCRVERGGGWMCGRCEGHIGVGQHGSSVQRLRNGSCSWTQHSRE